MVVACAVDVRRDDPLKSDLRAPVAPGDLVEDARSRILEDEKVVPEREDGDGWHELLEVILSRQSQVAVWGRAVV